MAAACTLIHLGWDPNTALNAVEAARGCPFPDTAEQEDRSTAAVDPSSTDQPAAADAQVDAASLEPVVDLSFQHGWHARILAETPNTLPSRQFIYPVQAERGRKRRSGGADPADRRKSPALPGDMRAGLPRFGGADRPLVLSAARGDLPGLRRLCIRDRHQRAG